MGPRILPGVRILLTLLGILLVAGAFAGVLLIGTFTNKPALRIAVALRDIDPGEQLQVGDFAIEEQTLDPHLARLYVNERDLPSYIGARVIDQLRKGDPLNKVKLTTDDSSIAKRRYGLILSDTNQVIMVLPVSADLIPSKINAGDFVNILFAAGESGMMQLPDTNAPTIQAHVASPALGNDYNFNITTSLTGTNAAPNMVLPLADVMLEHVEILDVNFQQVQNPNYGLRDTSGSERAFVDGPISSVVVRVPRGYQPVLAFAAASGKLRYAISSPLIDKTQLQPEAGMDWAKMVGLIRWKEQQAIARGETISKTLYPNYVPPAPAVVITTTASTAKP
jgi:hypothetical protein